MQRYTCQISIGGGDINNDDGDMENVVKPSQVKLKEKEKNKTGMEKPDTKEQTMKKNENITKIDSLSEEEIDEIMDRYDNVAPELKKRYLKFFKSADKGNRGYLTIRRMVPAMRKLGFTGSTYEICKIFVDLDANLDRKVTLEEYMSQMSRKSARQFSEDDLKEAFDKFDRNKDGYITREEFSYALNELNIKRLESHIDEMMESSDKDRDGKLSFDDFVKSYNSTARFDL